MSTAGNYLDEGDLEKLQAELRAAREEVRRLRSIEHERDFLKRREQSIVDATAPADGGQYRADIASAILRQRKDLDRAREEARLWKALAIARSEELDPRIVRHEPAIANAEAELRAAGIDPDAP